MLLKVKIKWRNLTVLFGLTCCWLYIFDGTFVTIDVTIATEVAFFFWLVFIFVNIISLLSPLWEHRRSLWIGTDEERPLCTLGVSVDRFYCSRVQRRKVLLLLPTLSRFGTTCFHHVVIKIRHLFWRMAACLTSTLLETGVDANDCKCSRDEQSSEAFRNTEELEIINFHWLTSTVVA
jgi:hypothetical protein